MKSININTEPDFKINPVEWVVWNMKEYNNTLIDSLQLLKQKNIINNL